MGKSNSSSSKSAAKHHKARRTISKSGERKRRKEKKKSRSQHKHKQKEKATDKTWRAYILTDVADEDIISKKGRNKGKRLFKKGAKTGQSLRISLPRKPASDLFEALSMDIIKTEGNKKHAEFMGSRVLKYGDPKDEDERSEIKVQVFSKLMLRRAMKKVQKVARMHQAKLKDKTKKAKFLKEFQHHITITKKLLDNGAKLVLEGNTYHYKELFKSDFHARWNGKLSAWVADVGHLEEMKEMLENGGVLVKVKKQKVEKLKHACSSSDDDSDSDSESDQDSSEGEGGDSADENSESSDSDEEDEEESEPESEAEESGDESAADNEEEGDSDNDEEEGEDSDQVNEEGDEVVSMSEDEMDTNRAKGGPKSKRSKKAKAAADLTAGETSEKCKKKRTPKKTSKHGNTLAETSTEAIAKTPPASSEQGKDEAEGAVDAQEEPEPARRCKRLKDKAEARSK